MGNLFDAFLESIEQHRPVGVNLAVWAMGLCTLALLSRWVDVLSFFFPWGRPEPLWLGVMVGGAVLGIIQYWVGGAVYHLAVFFAGGNGWFKTSQMIHVFAWLPFSLVVVLGLLTLWLAEALQIPLPPSYVISRIGMAGMALGGAASALVAYLAARRLQKTAPARSVACFVAVPLLMGTLFFEPGQVPFVYPYAQAADAFERGLAFMARRDFAKAEFAFERALNELHPDETEQRRLVYQNLGRLYEDWRRFEDAARAYTEAAQLARPDTAAYFVHLGEKALTRNEILEAVAFFKKAIGKDVTESMAHNQLGLIYLGVFGDGYANFEKALRHNQAALLERPQDPNLRETLALNWVALQNYEKALPLLEDLYAEQPQSAQIKYYLGLTYGHLGKHERGRVLVRDALRLNPELMSPEVIGWLAEGSE